MRKEAGLETGCPMAVGRWAHGGKEGGHEDTYRGYSGFIPVALKGNKAVGKGVSAREARIEPGGLSPP
jgi:hypothetical protein